MSLTEKIRRSIFTLGLFTTIVLGHVTASYLLYVITYPILDYYRYLILGLFLVNGLYLVAAIALQFTTLPEKQKIMTAAFGLLLNIPVSIIYLIIIISYEA